VEQRVELDLVGVLEGSDKSSTVRFGWDYLRHYEMLFAQFRRRPINLIEIGVQRGASLRVWKWYFSAAQIVGIDIDPACAALAGERIAIETGDQTDGPFLDAVCDKYPPSIVIDDGSHLAEHIIVTFERIFPLLAPGGLYVIEDMVFHFGANARAWQTETKRDVVVYFYALADDCLGRRGPAVGGGPFSTLVDAVYFMGGAIVLRKRPKGRVVNRALAAAEDYLATHGGNAGAQERLAHYILRHDGPPAKAAEALQVAIAQGGVDFNRLVLRGEIEAANARRDAAIAAWREAAAMANVTAAERFRLARLLGDMDVLDLALSQAEAALRLNPNNRHCAALVAQLRSRLALQQRP